MTKVYLSNADNTWQSTKYYIEIEATKIEYDIQNEVIATLRKPITKNQWGGAIPPDTKYLDFLQRNSAVTIYGHIDKYANRASNWSASVVNDVSVVRKRIEWMTNAGGTVKLIIGKDDGYYNSANTLQTGSFGGGTVNGEVFEGMINIKFIETEGDHIDRQSIVGSESYPSAVKEIADKYELILTLAVGTIR